MVEFKENTSIVVFGASGDLAKKKTFPALFGLVSIAFSKTQLTNFYSTEKGFSTILSRSLGTHVLSFLKRISRTGSLDSSRRKLRRERRKLKGFLKSIPM